MVSELCSREEVSAHAQSQPNQCARRVNTRYFFTSLRHHKLAMWAFKNWNNYSMSMVISSLQQFWVVDKCCEVRSKIKFLYDVQNFIIFLILHENRWTSSLPNFDFCTLLAKVVEGALVRLTGSEIQHSLLSKNWRYFTGRLLPLSRGQELQHWVSFILCIVLLLCDKVHTLVFDK